MQNLPCVTSFSCSYFQGCKWSLQQLRRYLVSKHGIEKVKIAHHPEKENLIANTSD